MPYCSVLRPSSILLALFALVSGCSLSVGAGAEANLGRRTASAGGACDGFESCDAVYRAAARRAARCHQTDMDCDDEEGDVTLSYRLLREQTLRELEELRSEAWQAQKDAQTACAPNPAAPTQP